MRASASAAVIDAIGTPSTVTVGTSACTAASVPRCTAVRAVRTALRALWWVGRAGITTAVGYLSVLTVAAWSVPRRRTSETTEQRHRFLILIPAHDEEGLVGQTLDSLKALDYPHDLFEVHVVADNCTDATADMVRSRGVEVHERTDPSAPGKGPALQWLRARLDARGVQHDAVVFLDADTSARPGFLRVVDRRLSDGERVVQAHYAVRDPGQTPVIAFRSAAFAARNYLRPLGRTRLGGTAGLYGNGMVFTPDVLKTRAWSDHLTEDAELQLELLEDGIKVAFEPSAVVEAEMPATTQASRSQHERWERGRVELTKRFVPGLLRRSVVGGPAGRVAYLDAAFDQAVPPFSILVAATTAWASLETIAVATGRHRPRQLVLSLAVAGAQAAFVLSSLRMVGAPRAVYRSLAQAPRLVVWKLMLWLRVLLGGKRTAWIRTSRNPSPNTRP